MIETIKEKAKNALQEKAVRRYAIVNIIVLIALLCEFIAFEYGILKILRYLVLVQGLFVIAWKDHKEQIILNNHLMILMGIRTFLLICEWLVYPTYGLSILLSSLMGALIGILVFGICYLVSRGGMGAGDVKLMAVLGFYVGRSVIMSVMILAVLSSAIYSIVNLIRKKTSLKAEIPFAPFIMIGTILAMALGM